MNGRSRRSAGRRWRLCLLGSVVLHAALLLGAPVAARLESGGSAPRVQPQALTVRQFLGGWNMMPPSTVTVERLAAVQAELPAQPRDPQAVMEAVMEAAPSLAVGDDSLYLPRRQLDEPPRPLDAIDLPWPANGPPAGHFSSAVSLFIDEVGDVQRVRIDEPGLPDSLQAIVQDVFLHARFSPGILMGQPVRSWIRIEVVFDAPSTAAPRGIRR